MERLATGRQDGQSPAGCEERGDRCRRREHPLAIVQDEQHPFGCQEGGQRLDEPLLGRLPDPERGGHGRHHQVSIGDGREIDEHYPVGIDVAHRGGDRDGQARLPHPAWSGERQQPHLVVLQAGPQCRELRLAPNEPGQRRRKGAWSEGRLRPRGRAPGGPGVPRRAAPRGRLAEASPSASRRTVSSRGARRAPRSSSLMPCRLSPARSASSSWDSAAALRSRRSRSPNDVLGSLIVLLPGCSRGVIRVLASPCGSSLAGPAQAAAAQCGHVARAMWARCASLDAGPRRMLHVCSGGRAQARRGRAYRPCVPGPRHRRDPRCSGSIVLAGRLSASRWYSPERSSPRWQSPRRNMPSPSCRPHRGTRPVATGRSKRAVLWSRPSSSPIPRGMRRVGMAQWNASGQACARAPRCPPARPKPPLMCWAPAGVMAAGLASGRGGLRAVDLAAVRAWDETSGYGPVETSRAAASAWLAGDASWNETSGYGAVEANCAHQ